MAADPLFFSTPYMSASVLSSTAQSGTAVTPVGHTQIAAGSTTLHTKITSIDVFHLAAAAGASVAGLLQIWIYNNSTYFYFDALQVVVITASTSVPAWRGGRNYKDLVLPAATPAWTLQAAFTTTQAANGAACVVQGATA